MYYHFINIENIIYYKENWAKKPNLVYSRFKTLPRKKRFLSAIPTVFSLVKSQFLNDGVDSH